MNAAAAAQCYDSPAIIALGKSTEAQFEALDQNTANTIKQIAQKMNEGHNEAEENSKTIAKNTRELNKQYYIIAQNILHNQILISELQNFVIDAIASSADAKSGKNRLDALKAELEALKKEVEK
jgi:hypothetical protein